MLGGRPEGLRRFVGGDKAEAVVIAPAFGAAHRVGDKPRATVDAGSRHLSSATRSVGRSVCQPDAGVVDDVVPVDAHHDHQARDACQTPRDCAG